MLLFLHAICFTFAKTCPDGWMQVDDSYNMMSTMKLTWFAAKEVQGVQKLFLDAITSQDSVLSVSK